jgi:GR25 family glycosyltransferase involved in LPS biosynthesis
MKIKVVIIGEENSTRAKALKYKFLSDDFELNFISPIFILTYDDSRIPSDFFYNFFSYYGRFPLLGEIGCTLSHNSARALLVNSGGLILEDDARIHNFPELLESVQKVLNDSKRPILLNLAKNLRIEEAPSTASKNRLLRNFGPSPTAVSYAVTGPAAKILIQKNSPIKFLSDWPPAKLLYFTLRYPPVYHGDLSTVSLISPNQNIRKRQNFSQRFSILVGYRYLSRTDSFDGFRSYLAIMIFPRVCFYLDKIKSFFQMLTFSLYNLFR